MLRFSKPPPTRVTLTDLCLRDRWEPIGALSLFFRYGENSGDSTHAEPHARTSLRTSSLARGSQCLFSEIVRRERKALVFSKYQNGPKQGKRIDGWPYLKCVLKLPLIAHSLNKR